MDNVILHTPRTEMRFPLPGLTPQAILDAIGDEDTIRFMSAVPSMTYTKENAEDFLDFLAYTKDSGTELELGIFDRASGSFIGMCTLENISLEYRVCELGYWLSKSYVGQGYMAECTKALLAYAKGALQMRSVNAYVVTGHSRSIHLLERLGFQRKELLKNDTENKGELVDRWWYRLSLQP